ncbi:MAG: CTP synthase, partial [Planctomycetes bacterium]|nr:CTP synthase [Planctomycetota bacterium]
EVYVLDDGSETDLDLGHYERFTNSPLSRASNYTTGQIYLRVIEKERRGEYLGRTVQVIPHITDEIKSTIRDLAGPDVDVVITELGGTVGDIEGLPFLEAIRQIPLDIGKEHCLFIHLTLVPYLKAAGELKTKPTQHSVGLLRQIGIQPDILIVRTERELSNEHTEKIALFCNLEKNAVIEEIDKDFSIYEVPLGLAEHKTDRLIIEKLGLPSGPLDLDDWQEMMNRARNPDHEVTIAVVGKYIEHKDAYKSVYEALDHAGFDKSARVRLLRIEAENLEKQGPEMLLRGIDGLLIPGGFGMRGSEGKIQAVQFARECEIPFFGICLGMQCAVIEFARNVLGFADANSTEFDAETEHPVICLLEEQQSVTDKGGTMRLGLQPCDLDEHSRSAACYGTTSIGERHRHRYEFNNEFRRSFAEKGMSAAGVSPDGKFVEIVEIPEHPWFIAVQFHPEFRSKPNRAHPLFRGFIEAALLYHRDPAHIPIS